MRAADFDDGVPVLGLLSQRIRQTPQRGEQIVLDLLREGHVHGCGKRVVGALPHIDMVVGVNRFFALESIPLGQLNRSVRNHLVAIHVARRSRTGLEHVHREFPIQFSFRYLATGTQEGLDLCLVQRVFAAPGEFAEVAVGYSAGVLYQSQGMNQGGR